MSRLVAPSSDDVSSGLRLTISTPHVSAHIHSRERKLAFLNLNPNQNLIMKKTTFRTNLLAVGIAVAATLSAALVPLTSHAYDENSTSSVNVDTKGIGLRGYDPVAYFTIGAPTPGNSAFTAKHNGITFHFASAANRATFQADPSKYAPQFGGFCAMGVVLEKKLDGDPDAWYVADGKLYLNVNKDVQKKWLQDVSGNNKKAEQIWPSIRNKSPKSLG